MTSGAVTFLLFVLLSMLRNSLGGVGLALVYVPLFNDVCKTRLAVTEAFQVDFATEEAHLSKKEKLWRVI